MHFIAITAAKALALQSPDLRQALGDLGNPRTWRPHRFGVPGVLRLMCQLFCDRRSARTGSRGSATSVPCRSGLPDLGRRWPQSGISVLESAVRGYPRVSYWREEVAMCSGDRLVADFIAGTDARPGLPEELDEHLTTTVNGQWVVWAHKLARQEGDLFVPLTGGPGYPADARAECRYRPSAGRTDRPFAGPACGPTPPTVRSRS